MMLSLFRGQILSHIFSLLFHWLGVINKLSDDKVQKAILIVPLLRSEFWFPRHKDLMTMPHNPNADYLFYCSTTFVTLQLSANISRVEDYFQRLSQSSLDLGNKEPVNSTPWHGNDGLFGVHR